MSSESEPRFIQLFQGSEFAFVNNGVLYRSYSPSTNSYDVTAFLDKDTFYRFLTEQFQDYRDDLVYAAFDPEALDARQRGVALAVFMKKRRSGGL